MAVNRSLVLYPRFADHGVRRGAVYQSPSQQEHRQRTHVPALRRDTEPPLTLRVGYIIDLLNLETQS